MMIILSSCNRYKGIQDHQIYGYAYIKDSLDIQPQKPFNGIIYLNRGNDTTNYLFQTSADSVGKFSFQSMGKQQAVIYSRFIKNGTEYVGQIKLDESNSSAIQKLIITPLYNSGISLAFAKNGLIPKFPFRFYTSKLAATVDSIKFATINDKTDKNGYFIRYNLVAGKYYVVAKEVIGGYSYNVLDSFNIKKGDIFKKEIELK